MDGEQLEEEECPSTTSRVEQQSRDPVSASSAKEHSADSCDASKPASGTASSLEDQRHETVTDSTHTSHVGTASHSDSEAHTNDVAVNSNQSEPAPPQSSTTPTERNAPVVSAGDHTASPEPAIPESDPISIVLESAAQLGSTIPVPRPPSVSDESVTSSQDDANTKPSQNVSPDPANEPRPSCLSPLPDSSSATEPMELQHSRSEGVGQRGGGGGGEMAALLLQTAGVQLQREGEGATGGGGEMEERVDSPANQDDRQLEQLSEVLLDSDLSPSDSEAADAMAGGGGGGNGAGERKRVRFADQLEEKEGQTANPSGHHGARSPPPRLPLVAGENKHPGVPVNASPTSPRQQPLSPLTPVHSAEELIAGVEYPAEYLGSTPVLFGSGGAQTARMYQAQQAVKLIKDPEVESRPHCTVTLKISTRGIKIADSNTNVDLMVHPLHTISYVADIESVLVVMAHKTPPPPAQPASRPGSTPTSPSELPSVKMTCHVLDTPDARQVAVVIGQAFSTAYKEFLKSHGISEEALEEEEYKHILNAQSVSRSEVESLSDRNKTKKLTIAKHRGELMGLMVMASGYGSAIPACVITQLSKTGAAARSGLLNIGDNIISLNGVSLVGVPIKTCNEHIKKCRGLNVVKMEVVSCHAVVEVNIVRPDLRYKLGFNVHEDVICSLTRGSIAERCGLRVGHKIIEINGTSTVGMKHADIVHLLSSTVGDLHMRTMPHLMYQLLTGQVQPVYH